MSRGLWRLGTQDHATAFWSAVAQMHGASLHRSYRFREVKKTLRPETASSPRKRRPDQAPRKYKDTVAFAQVQALWQPMKKKTLRLNRAPFMPVINGTQLILLG